MGFYSKYIFPRIIDKMMSTGYMKKARTAVLSEVSGNVFEVGFGTGLNLDFYPDSVTKITTADINPGMNKKALKRIQLSKIEVDHNVINGESLPFEEELFDSVVCTWTLCSIEQVDRALQEFRRVLKPEGKFFFVEHGLADDEKVQKWQNRLATASRGIRSNCSRCSASRA